MVGLISRRYSRCECWTVRFRIGLPICMGWSKEKSKKYFKEYYQKNKKRYFDAAKKWKMETKKWFYETYKDRLICATCGEKDIRCLDFHHRNPNQKEYKISALLYGFSRKKIVIEIEKCDVLCANCHRKFHST